MTGKDFKEALPKVREYLESCDFLVASYLFGSWAVDEQRADSDIDVAILFDEGIDPKKRRDLERDVFFELTRLWRTDRIDLQVINELPPSLRYRIIHQGIRLSDNRPEKRVEFEVQTDAEYWDFQWLEEEYDRYALKRLRKKYGPN